MFHSPESSGSLARDISPASDLYSVGVLLFCMVADRPPILASNASDYLDKQLRTEAPRLREIGFDIPSALDDIVARLLCRDPQDRYETAAGLLYDLFQFATSLTDTTSINSFAIGTHDLRSGLTEASLVGRDEEISFVRKTLDDAKAGNPHVVVVLGPESSDRQRFLDEVALVSSAQGMRVLRGGASTGNPKPLQSLQPVLAKVTSICVNDSALAKRLSEATREHGAALSELLPALSGLWESSDRNAGPDAYGTQRAAIALEELFAALALESQGVAFLFDDLVGADDLTQTVVRSLADRAHRQQGRLHLHLLASGEAIEGLEFCPKDFRIELGPLSDEALTLYLQSSSGALSKVITQSIVDVADGDTTMASTILRRMIDTGVVSTSPHGWQANGPLSEALRGDECIAESLEQQLGRTFTRRAANPEGCSHYWAGLSAQGSVSRHRVFLCGGSRSLQ